MDLSQEEMDTSVLNDSTVQHNSTSLSATFQNDTTLSSATSQRPAAKNNLRVPANYFDLDDILALNERVPCQVEQDLFKMGYLDQSTDDEHLPKGTKLELPIWFAKEFHSEQVKVLKIDAPKGELFGFNDFDIKIFSQKNCKSKFSPLQSASFQQATTIRSDRSSAPTQR